MPEYYIKATAKVRSTRKVSYQCENCSGEFSYLLTLKGSDEQMDQTYRSEAVHRQKELSELALTKAKEQLNDQINALTERKDYGFEKCPACGYTQSWMLDAESTGQIGKNVVNPILVISGLFGVGSIFVFINGRNVLPICVASFIFWLIIIFLVFWFGKKIEEPNKDFKIVERKNTPVVAWSDPEVVN